MGVDSESHARARLVARRSDSLRAIQRRRAAEDALLDAVLLPHAGDGDPQSVGVLGQTLLLRALTRLERQPGIAGVVAWMLDADGEPHVRAAQPPRFAHHITLDAALYASLAKLPEATRLTDGDLPAALAPLAARGVSVVAPVAGLGGAPVALLLLFSERAGRLLRPRSMAVLNEVTGRLSSAMSAQLALDRLAALDAAVQRLDRLAALGGLVAEIVHEVRNPLVSVKTFLQLLPERLDDPDFHQDFRLLVSEEVERLERMLSDLLRHARPGNAAATNPSASVAGAIETTLQLLTYRCRERGIELVTRIAAPLPSVALSEDAMRQLLLNLLLNATEVTEPGGRVLLSVDWSPHAINHLELVVEDEGPGIAPDLAARLFEPFWTTRAEGVGGLGLAICKRIVEEAGGSIRVDERRQGGACFRIELKIAS